MIPWSMVYRITRDRNLENPRRIQRKVTQQRATATEWNNKESVKSDF